MTLDKDVAPQKAGDFAGGEVAPLQSEDPWAVLGSNQ